VLPIGVRIVTAGWDAACRCIVLGWDNYSGAYLDGLDVAVGSVADADFVLALGTESVCGVSVHRRCAY
jgi:hypothetical protein